MPQRTNWFQESTVRRRHIEAYLTVITVILVICFVIGIYRQETDAAKRVACAQRLKRIIVAFEMYAQDHDNEYPPQENWSRSLLPYIDTLEIYFCPSDEEFPNANGKHDKKRTFQDRTSYWYIRPESSDDPSSLTVAGDRMYFNMVGNHKNGGNIVFFDSHVKWYSLDQWQKHHFYTEQLSHKSGSK